MSTTPDKFISLASSQSFLKKWRQLLDVQILFWTSTFFLDVQTEIAERPTIFFGFLKIGLDLAGLVGLADLAGLAGLAGFATSSPPFK